MGWDGIGVVVFLLITSICKLFSCVLRGVYAFQDGRRGLSTFKNMLFLTQEGRLLRARRAYIRMQNVTRWFLVGYILGCRRLYLRVVRVSAWWVVRIFYDFIEVLQVVRKIWVYAYNTIHMRSWAYFLSQKTFLSLMLDIFFLSQRTRRSRRF